MLKQYMLEYMQLKAGKEALDGKDVSGYKEARESIVQAIQELSKYEEKKKKEYINHAV